MQTKLMVYNARAHQDPRDDELMGEIGGPGALVMSVDPDSVRHVWSACGPQSIILIRDWGATDSPERMKEIQANPEQAARQHVDYFLSIWHRFDFIPDGHKYAVLANELPCNHHNAVEIDGFYRYWHTAITYAAERGLPILALNISVGWPDNDGPDTPPGWKHPKWAGLIADIRTANQGRATTLVLVGLHEYCHPADGPELGWGWHIGRCLWLIREAPDLRIVISEWGVDGYVNPLTPGARKTEGITGFQLNGISFDQMVDWAIWCDGQYRHYEQIVGHCWYLCDHQAMNQWSWDFRPFVIDSPRNNRVVNYARDVRDGKVPLPAALPLPGPNGGPVTGQPPAPAPPKPEAPVIPEKPPVVISEPGPEWDGDLGKLIEELALQIDVLAHIGAEIKAKAPTASAPEATVIAPRLRMPVVGTVTQRFGSKAIDYSRFGLIAHNGLDIGAPTGTSVIASHSGQCWVYDDPGGYGKTVEVWYPKIGSEGVYKTIYAHLSEHVAHHNQLIEPGMILGKCGSTGNSTGPHLHFGIKFLKGKNPGYNGWVDPEPFME
jgi:murein DD-endopeptidase MepM/ murein hydrolase activator NlpD